MDGAKQSENQSSDFKGTSSLPVTESQLSITEYNIIKSKIENAWFGSEKGLKAIIWIKLDIKGNVLEARVQPIKCMAEQGCDALFKAAERAIYEASPFDNLLPERYDMWKELQINFDTITTPP